MTGPQQLFGFSIAYDKEFVSDLFSIPHELRPSLESLHNDALKGSGRIIQRLHKLVGQYPLVPQLKNYLSVAYFNSGRTEEALRLNRQLIREHPDFLFGHLNLAHEYFHKKQYEKIPRVLGEDLELGEFFTHRDCFHLTEVTGYYEIAIMYFCATGNMEAAESRYDKLDELAPDHPDTLAVETYITRGRMEEGLRIMEEENETRISVSPHPYNRVLQTTTPPEFIHQEISWLYENGLNIESEKLRQILSLPEQTLISDLKIVVRDSMARYEYFAHMVEAEGWQEKKLNFPLVFLSIPV
jgi:tetratricopeptide (TPR) repeat protein